MKSQILSNSGKKEIELPSVFSYEIREDIAQKFNEISKVQQPYGPYVEAGKQVSASGKMRHNRRRWRTAYGKGISRVPRKIFWRRGDHFYWQGAEVASSRGGRAAHPPKVAHFQVKRKMNQKEAVIAIKSAISGTSNLEMLNKRYETLRQAKLNLPIIISSDILKLKTKELYAFLEKILGEAWKVALKNKELRAGKGKMRGRTYKENAGLLLVIGKDEKLRLQGIEIKNLPDLDIADLWPLGRLTVYSENAIKELGEVKEI